VVAGSHAAAVRTYSECLNLTTTTKSSEFRMLRYVSPKNIGYRADGQTVRGFSSKFVCGEFCELLVLYRFDFAGMDSWTHPVERHPDSGGGNNKSHPHGCCSCPISLSR
jgi:hypothetical protein